MIARNRQHPHATRRPGGLLALAAIVCAATGATAGDLSGSFSLGTGYYDHPLGIEGETPAGFLTQALRISTRLGASPTTSRPLPDVVKLGYEGNASQFDNETELGNMRHALGLEYFHTSPVAECDPRAHSLSLGAQGALRRYEGGYTIYDYHELYAYAAFRRHAGTNTLWSGFGALRLRRYGELPEESFVEPHGQLKVQRFFSGRTTLGLSARFGVKTYNDSAASAVWGTPNLPSTSQAAARLEFSQGVSDRVGLRVRVDSRHTLSDFPYYVSEDIFDSPLLDTYAHQGWDALAVLKWLAPLQVWTELGYSRGEHDYGSLLFAGTPAGQTRDDSVAEIFTTLRRRLAGHRDGPELQLTAGWRDQRSTIDTYTYDGLFAHTSLAWNF